MDLNIVRAELERIQEEAVERGDYSFNMTFNLINNFGIFKNNMKTILQLIRNSFISNADHIWRFESRT